MAARVEHLCCHTARNIFTAVTASSCSSTGSPVVFHRLFHGTTSNSAGHNKWSKIKRPKMAADLERSKRTGKICSEIMSSVRLGGDNPEFNLRLASVLSRAKKAGIPKLTVSNAIEAGKGKSGEGAESLTFAGRGPSDYSLIIEAVTNNKRRTRPEIKNLLSKHGADLMSEATLYQFQQKGIIIVSGQSISDKAKALEIAITIGAEDVYAFHDDFDEDCFKFICDTQDLKTVISKAEEEDLDVLRGSLEFVPTTTILLSGDRLQKAEELVSVLEDHVEVTRVYHNFINAEKNEDS